MQRPSPRQPNQPTNTRNATSRFDPASNGRSRERSHLRGEAMATRQPRQALPTHPMICSDQPFLVSSSRDLDQAIGHLRVSRQFGFDTEFIGEQSYFPKLCLIQAATAKHIFVIDTMTRRLDLTPFWELVADASIEKIVHAAFQDLEPAARYTGKPPANIFDTQIAGAFVGFPYPAGLARMVKSFIDFDLSKGLKFSQWDRRPLSDAQLYYAASDVRFLPLLGKKIKEQLTQAGNTQAASEECATLCDASHYQFDPKVQSHRVRGASSLKSRELAVLHKLVQWRDDQARHHDMPPRTFMSDQVIVSLARKPITSTDDLDRVAEMIGPIAIQHGQALIQATQDGLALPKSQLPDPLRIKESPFETENMASLWSTIEAMANTHHIDPMMICSRAELSETLRRLACGVMPTSSKLFTGWRGKLLGPIIHQALTASPPKPPTSET